MVNVHSVQVVVAVVCNDDLVCMVCKCTAVCHVLLGYRTGRFIGEDFILAIGDLFNFSPIFKTPTKYIPTIN